MNAFYQHHKNSIEFGYWLWFIPLILAAAARTLASASPWTARATLMSQKVELPVILDPCKKED